MIVDGNVKMIYSGSTGGIQVFDDGTTRLKGDATAWKDMVMDLIGKKVTVNNGRVDYDFDNMAMKFQNNGDINTANDLVGGNLEIDHVFKVGNSTTFKPHIHWFQEVSSGSVINFELTMKWRLQRNNHAKTDTWTTVTLSAGTNDVFDFTGEADGFYNQITRFPEITVDCSISDTFQVKMTRTDALAGDMLVYFFDLHGEVDSYGSDNEITKA
jgi:hypothetical protein